MRTAILVVLAASTIAACEAVHPGSTLGRLLPLCALVLTVLLGARQVRGETPDGGTDADPDAADATTDAADSAEDDARVGPCLAPDADLSPCLSTPPDDEDAVRACLCTLGPPGESTGAPLVGAAALTLALGLRRRRDDDDVDSREAVLTRLLASGRLPPDVAARLRPPASDDEP